MNGKEKNTPEFYDPDDAPDLSQGDWPERLSKVPVRHGPPPIEELMAGRDRSASRSVDPEGVSNPSKSDGPEKITRVRVRRGRPPLEKPKVSTTIRLSRDVIDHFKSGGKGWQTRIDQALREWIGKRDAA